MKLLIGVTGSVAAVKLPFLVETLYQQIPSMEIRIVCTERSIGFFALNDDRLKNCLIYRDGDEWKLWSEMGDPVLHIQLRDWADAFLIAPLDANTLAKLANGLCDNLLTCVARAWDLERKRDRMVVCPAMNTHMWQHPLTAIHLTTLRSLGISVIEPIEKRLACGDTGIGAMENVTCIVERLKLSFL